MIQERRKQYGDIRLLDIECSEPYDWCIENVTHIRVSIPSSYENEAKMLEKGFFLADRTLDVSINLFENDLNYDQMIRLNTSLLSGGREEELLEIAKECFPTDRRFNLSYEPDPVIAEMVLSGWIDELEGYYICEIKGNLVGFLALVDNNESRFIKLAAVTKKYRPTGAGISLYASAARDCKQEGIKFLKGRISSINTGVMNLYAYLGGVFSNPLDVYIKEMH